MQKAQASFDYIKLEAAIVLEMEQALQTYRAMYDDLYIVALDCSSDLWSIGLMANTKTYLAEQADKDAEDYWYYKYCEEEWCIFATFDKLSAEMHQYMKKLHDTTDDTEHFEQHRAAIIATCKKALCQLIASPFYQAYTDILLTFNVREYLEQEERIAIFERLNGAVRAQEYAEHIEEFV
ncbi:DUF4303 domain-containing protein [Lysinibacillus sp. NPDC098008]|uniref:DUF4303 domain-containing protein n=1 Tax=Lysinibacillus sp. NPDC098008 TaxID=3364146 RepID=UPI0037F70DA9